MTRACFWMMPIKLGVVVVPPSLHASSPSSSDMWESRWYSKCVFKGTKDDDLRRRLVNETACYMAVVEPCPDSCTFGKCCLRHGYNPNTVFKARSDFYELKVKDRLPHVVDLLKPYNNLEACIAEYEKRSESSDDNYTRVGHYKWHHFVPNDNGGFIEVCSQKFASVHGMSMSMLERAKEFLYKNAKSHNSLPEKCQKERKNACNEFYKGISGDSDKVSFVVKWLIKWAKEGYGELQPHGDPATQKSDEDAVYRLHFRSWNLIYGCYLKACGETVDKVDIKEFKRIFRFHDKLRNIYRSRQKANFAICSTCKNNRQRFINTSRHDTEALEGFTSVWKDHIDEVVGVRGIYNDNVVESCMNGGSLLIEIDAWSKNASQVYQRLL